MTTLRTLWADHRANLAIFAASALLSFLACIGG